MKEFMNCQATLVVVLGSQASESDRMWPFAQGHAPHDHP